MKYGNRRRRTQAGRGFDEAAKIAQEHGMTLRSLAYADKPSDVTQYRIEGPNGEWYKNLYPGNQRIYCPDKAKQGPFVAMKIGQRWDLVDVVKACIKAMESDRYKRKMAEQNRPDMFSGDAIDTREAIVQLVSAIVKTEGTTEQEAFRDLITDIRHVCDARKWNFEEAMKGSYEVYLEEKADPDFECFPKERIEGPPAEEMISLSKDNRDL